METRVFSADMWEHIFLKCVLFSFNRGNTNSAKYYKWEDL